MTAGDENELSDAVLRQFATSVNTLVIGTIEEWGGRLHRGVIIGTIIEALLCQACWWGVNMSSRPDFEKLFQRCLEVAEARLAAMDAAGDAPKQ